MWTVGVYHDVSSWLRLVAEYNHGELDTGVGGGTPALFFLNLGSVVLDIGVFCAEYFEFCSSEYLRVSEVAIEEMLRPRKRE